MRGSQISKNPELPQASPDDSSAIRSPQHRVMTVHTTTAQTHIYGSHDEGNTLDSDPQSCKYSIEPQSTVANLDDSPTTGEVQTHSLQRDLELTELRHELDAAHAVITTLESQLLEARAEKAHFKRSSYEATRELRQIRRRLYNIATVTGRRRTCKLGPSTTTVTKRKQTPELRLSPAIVTRPEDSEIPQLQLSMTKTPSSSRNASTSPTSSISGNSHSSIYYVDPVTGQRKVEVFAGLWMDADEQAQLVVSPPPPHWRRRLEDAEEHDHTSADTSA